MYCNWKKKVQEMISGLFVYFSEKICEKQLAKKDLVAILFVYFTSSFPFSTW